MSDTAGQFGARRGARDFVTLLTLGAALLAPSAIGAQGSPFVPVDDPAYYYIDALIARGQLDALSALERPYTVAAILRALEAGSGHRKASGVVGDWKRLLAEAARRYTPSPSPGQSRGGRREGRREVRREGRREGRREVRREGRRDEPGAGSRGGMAVGADLSLLGAFQSSAQRELMLSDGREGAYPGAQLRAAAVAGPLVVAGRGFADNRLRADPDFAGRKDRGVSGRVEDAYISGQWRYANVFFGRLGRNWGPGSMDGLQIGHSVYSYDHIYARVGTDRLGLATMFARLDDTPGTFSPLVQRYLAVHRLAGRWRGLEIAATETYIAAGTNRSFDWTLANPLVPFILAQYNDRVEGNYSVGLDAALRTNAGLFGAQLLIDDVQVDSCDPRCGEPASFGLTFTAEGVPLVGAQRLFASYTRVSSLTYRTPEVGERYARQGVGLGRAFSDYDEARAGLDIALVPRIPLRAYAAYRRQGEGDYRAPFPPETEYATTPGFLIGGVARVARVGVSGGGLLPGGLFLSADVGFNRVGGTAPSAPADGFQGRVRVSFEPRLTSVRTLLR